MVKIQVLVLDDEARVRDVMVDVLASAGYTVDAIASAAEALDRFRELDPDLVLLDMMMPGVDGFEFLARLRAEPLSSRVPVLITSGLGGTLARAIDPRSAETLGIVGVLPKPVAFETMLEHVRRVVGPGARAAAR
ncbi:MAG: response regulator [Candidatus Rokubacteria bacterium]|nr:response regulator [Candidatus Rokubacteria bacterium]